MHTRRQRRTDRRKADKGGRGGRQSRGQGRRAARRRKDGEQDGGVGRDTGRAERGRTEIQSDVRCIFELATAY